MAGLGDKIEDSLKRWGIHDKWKAWFPDCNCESRKEWLNKVSPGTPTMDDHQAERMERLLATYRTTFTRGDSLEIYSLYNELHGTSKKPKGCGPCAKQVFTKLLAAYENYKLSE